ncbi:uncharacterized protein LOC107042012 [Diachasma alloeum]|uniref:uncharacterized protein LOC107042012 n=1 Tax=Diachasma alloeum TaxID=454923 RepID=UPI00073835F0|nr:uncharacterized protein LOC107042012 [Diachasma alloeum]
MSLLTREQFNAFVERAPDNDYLAVKICFMVGASGCLRRKELWRLENQDVTDNGHQLILEIPRTKWNYPRRFIISDDWYLKTKEYMILRPANNHHDYFMLKYAKGRCSRSRMSSEEIRMTPKVIAEYLELAEPQNYLRFNISNFWE